MIIEASEKLQEDVVEGCKRLVRVYIDESVDSEGRTKYRYKELVFSTNDSQEYIDIRLAKVKACLYGELRAAEYPPMEDYLDAIVEGDTKAVEEYRRKCLEVKAKYPKELVYGYEFGGRIKDLNGTNLVTGISFGKPIEKKGLKYGSGV